MKSNICGSNFPHRTSAEGLAGTMIKDPAGLPGGGLNTPDALHLALTKHGGCTIFWTHDKRWRQS
jgi:hypothetical protein